MEKRDERYLFEKGSVKDIVVRLALPTVLGQMITVIYNMADTFFVGMLSDDAAMTAVTVAMPCFMLLSAISNLFGIGGAGAVSRALGRGEREKARDESSASFWGALISGLLYSLLVYVFIDPVTDALGGMAPEVHGLAREYIIVAVSLGGMATVMSAFLSHMIRSEGRGAEASGGIVLGGVLNMILDPIFMFRIMPEGMEVTGAAVATALSNLFSLVFFIAVSLKSRRSTVVSVSPSRAIRGLKSSGEILSSGLPAFTMTLCENLSYAVLDFLIAGFGTAVQAGVGVAKKINMLAHSLVRGMAQGMLPAIAYSYASGSRERMRRISRASQCFSVGASLVCMASFLAFAPALSSVFLEEGSESAICAARMLRLFSIGAPFSAFAYTSISFFQATGRGGRALSLALLRKGALDIPLMLVLVSVKGAYGAALATPVADAVCALVSAVMMWSFMKHHVVLRMEKVPPQCEELRDMERKPLTATC